MLFCLNEFFFYLLFFIYYYFNIFSPNIYLNVPSRSVTLSELRKLKRQFININKTFTSLSLNKVAELFTDYLNDNLS